MKPEVFTIKCYRDAPGDTKVADTFLRETLDKAKSVAWTRLLNFSEDRITPAFQRPHTGVLVGEDGRIISTFRVEPALTGGNHVVEVIDANRP